MAAELARNSELLLYGKGTILHTQMKLELRRSIDDQNINRRKLRQVEEQLPQYFCGPANLYDNLYYTIVDYIPPVIRY